MRAPSRNEPATGGSGDTLIDSVADWLMSQALGDTDPGTLLETCSQRLLGAGMPLWRTHLAFNILHPQYDALGFTWLRDTGLQPVDHFRESDQMSKQWARSPYSQLVERGLPFLRRRLDGPEALIDFPILQDLQDQGATDYFAYAIAFREPRDGRTEVEDGMVGSWVTDRPDGFTDREIRSLLRIQQRLGVACKMTIREQITRNILSAYLGPDAGRQVLNGQIHRGDGETIHAVIWYSDLRNSSGLADTLAPEDFISLVNRYFECTAGAVLANNGEVLRFIGDAVLAIFPIRDTGMTVAEACDKALAAAREASLRIAKANKEAKKGSGVPLAFGLGLHIGDVMYGNIGVPERVEFSVVGPAANEVARLEDLTKSLDCEILVSDRFAEAIELDWQPLGDHKLRGVGEPMTVYALPN